MSDFNAMLNDLSAKYYTMGYEAAKKEIVHCKDCKYYDDREWLKCPMLDTTEKDDFCSRAERKEE